MDVIYRTAKRGEWEVFGIETWDDLLNHVYGEFNREKNKYKGRQGLDRAIQELREFKKKHGKMPTSVSKGMPRIYNMIQRGGYGENLM